MSHRGFAIDRPESDDEEDIVVSAARSQVSDSDRDLLRADDQIVQALQQKSHSKLTSGRSFLPKRKLKFSDYIPLEESRGKTSPNGSNGALSGDESQEESDYDIEIDLETQPVRRRIHHNRSNQSLIVLVMIGLGVLFLMLLRSEGGGSSAGGGGGGGTSSDSKGGHDEDKGMGDHDHQDKPPPSHPNIDRFKPISKNPISNGTHWFFPTTIVVSLDGFHPHYVSPDLTPNLHSLFTNYSAAPYMEPSFPTQTFPNHWTMVTGFYPSNHGIVGNTFWDPHLQIEFDGAHPNMSQELVNQMYGGEPIWRTAYYQGVKTAVHMWPGSEVKWDDPVPGDDAKTQSSIWSLDPFNAEEPLDDKVTRVFDWVDVDSPEDRPELMLMYIYEVDKYGHEFGISGPELRSAISNVDNLIGKLQANIRERHLQDIVNLIVVSDHGMAPTSNDRLRYLEDLIDMDSIYKREGWPLVGVRLKNESNLEAVYESLVQKQTADSHWQVFKREDMPLEWNFGGTNADFDYRIAPLYIVPEVGWSITTHADMEKNGGDYKPHGVHGYNNTDILMRSMFLAQGPYFRKHGNERHLYKPFPNVDLYSIVCDTLNLEPSKSDGVPAKRALQPLGNWHDVQEYPGVEFSAEILKINSTYDILFSQVADGKHAESWLETAEDAIHDAYDHVHDWLSGDHKDHTD